VKETPPQREGKGLRRSVNQSDRSSWDERKRRSNEGADERILESKRRRVEVRRKRSISALNQIQAGAKRARDVGAVRVAAENWRKKRAKVAKSRRWREVEGKQLLNWEGGSWREGLRVEPIRLSRDLRP